MIRPFDRSRRDSALSQLTTRQLRDVIGPNHLLIWIDEQLDFAKRCAQRPPRQRREEFSKLAGFELPGVRT